MKFGIFYEHQIPRPWAEDGELNLYREALDQVELADKIGFDVAWEVEHHFLEEYSHSSAPEVFLAACSQRTKNIRLGHGIMLMAPGYNHPARCAERVATLDLVSEGRVEWGTGESASRAELEGFGVSVENKRDMWREATEQAANMLAMTPYPGFEGKYFSMPCRNIVPKPAQRPHPPLWVACSKRETIHLAARCGIGALTFAFVDPEEASQWVAEYYDIIKSEECVPIGHTVNANIAMVTAFSIHNDEEEAIRRGLDGAQFFRYALGHHYIFGEHTPGHTDIWNRYERAKERLPQPEMSRGMGKPEALSGHLRKFQAAGVDQVIFIQQAGNNAHEHICQALELFGSNVLPEFKDGEAARQAKKDEELAPYIEAALARKKRMPALTPETTPPIIALGREISEKDKAERARISGGRRILEDPLAAEDAKSKNAAE